MVLFNYALKELTAKIVYYGPGLSGKTTNLKYIHEELPIKSKGRMLTLATETDRTLYFDFLPVEAGVVRGVKTRIQLYTVPGQVFYNATRRMVLKAADGVVFVADSQKDLLEANLESLENLRENLLAQDLNLEEMPLVMQYNKRDLEDALDLEEMNDKLNTLNAPFYAAVATEGVGVEDTLKAITSLVLKSVIEKYGAAQASGMPAPQPVARAEAPSASAGGNLLEKDKTDPLAAFRAVAANASQVEEIFSGLGWESEPPAGSLTYRKQEHAKPGPHGTQPPVEPRSGGTKPDAMRLAKEMAKQTLASRKPVEKNASLRESRTSKMDELNLEGILDEALKVDERVGVEAAPRPPKTLRDELDIQGAEEHRLSGSLEEVLGVGSEEGAAEPIPLGTEKPFLRVSPSARWPLADDAQTLLENRIDALSTTPGAVKTPAAIEDPSRTRLVNEVRLSTASARSPRESTSAKVQAPAVHVQLDAIGGSDEPQTVVVPVRISIDRATSEIHLNLSLHIKINRAD